MTTTTLESLRDELGLPSFVGNDPYQARFRLYSADAVCFDVDSTVIAEEGIDVLAEFLGKGEEVAELTRGAMDGNTKFEDALAARLELLRPSRSQILACLEENPPRLTPGVRELVESLKEAGIDVWLVSGGFRIMIGPVADELGIPSDNVIANTILFDDEADGDEGPYAGFDADEPTSRDMGKAKAVQTVIDRLAEKLDKPADEVVVVMVGDGATDAQAKPPARAFIGFGGIAARDAVIAKADWFVTDFDDITRVFRFLKIDEE